MAVGPTTAERFGLDDPTAWPADKASWRSYPVDLSFLNAPEKPASKASSSLPRMNHPLSIIRHNAVSQLFA